MTKWAISRLRDNPPVAVDWCKPDTDKERIMSLCQVTNDLHFSRHTGEVFKVFEVKNAGN